MSDRLKLPEGFSFEEEEIIEEVPKELEDGTLLEEAKPIPEDAPVTKILFPFIILAVSYFIDIINFYNIFQIIRT